MVVVATERSEVAGMLPLGKVSSGLKGKDGLSLVKTLGGFCEIKA